MIIPTTTFKTMTMMMKMDECREIIANAILNIELEVVDLRVKLLDLNFYGLELTSKIQETEDVPASLMEEVEEREEIASKCEQLELQIYAQELTLEILKSQESEEEDMCNTL